MFNEILWIKPKLDTSTARQMEENLSSRFTRVASRFGQGLKAVIKGSILGISLGLISRLLNPIEALEDKIKKLLGEGEDIKDLADKLNVSPENAGKLRQVQDVAHSLGLTPDQFKDMLLKYSQAVDKAREELANPFTQRSDSTVAVSQFVGEKDKLKSFIQFIQSLKAAGEGPGIDVALSDRAKRLTQEAAVENKKLTAQERQDLIAKGELIPGAVLQQSQREDLLSKGEIRRLSGSETRQKFEKDVFGDFQTGAAKRLIDVNLDEQAKSIKEPPVETLNKAVNRAASLAQQKRALDVQNQTQDFVATSNKVNSKMIQDMAKADQLQLERDQKQLDSFNDLKKASIAIEQVKGLFMEANTSISKGIGYLADMTDFVLKLKGSRLFRGIFGSSGTGKGE